MGNSSSKRRASRSNSQIPDVYSYSAPSADSVGRLSETLIASVHREFAEKYGHVFSSGIPEMNTETQAYHALDHVGLPEVNLVIGIDFTDQNRSTGSQCYEGGNLHCKRYMGFTNPYEVTLSVISQTLGLYDNREVRIPCFGFGDETTTDKAVFSFKGFAQPCIGFPEVISKYRDLSGAVIMAGPLSLAPIINTACSQVRQSGGKFHVLVILFSGRVSSSNSVSSGELSDQELATIEALNEASQLPLSISIVGVGSPSQDNTKELLDFFLGHKRFKNVRFLDFKSIAPNGQPYSSEVRSALGLSIFMDVPLHYQHCILHKMVTPTMRPSSVEAMAPMQLTLEESSTARSSPSTPNNSSMLNTPSTPISPSIPISPSMSNSPLPPLETRDVCLDNCPVCLDNRKNWAFRCGHLVCENCKGQLTFCPICRGSTRRGMKVYL